MRPFAAVAVVAVGTTLSAAVLAQESPNEIARRELIAQADAARRASDHGRALSLYERASELRMTPSLRQMLAYEHHALGHVLEAFDHADRCVQEANVAAALRERERILETCAAIVRVYQDRLGRVTLRVPDPQPEGLRVRVQGREVPSALWGVAYPVLPGLVVVDASDAEGRTFRSEVPLEAGTTREVTLALSAPPRPAPSAPAMPATPTTPRMERGPGVGPWLVAGSGALALGAAAVFGVLRADARRDRDAQCSVISGREAEGVFCDPSAQDHQSDFVAYTIATNVAFGVGAAAVAGGVLWYVLARSRARSHAPTVSVMASPGGAGVTLVGAF